MAASDPEALRVRALIVEAQAIERAAWVWSVLYRAEGRLWRRLTNRRAGVIVAPGPTRSHWASRAGGGSTGVTHLLRSLLGRTRNQLKLLHLDPNYRRARQRAPAHPRDDPAASRDENAREPLVVITEI